jgi:hypothetical protein
MKPRSLMLGMALCSLVVSGARVDGASEHLLRSEVTLGTKTVTVFFTSPATEGEPPVLTLSLPNQAPHPVTPEELASGRATLTLDRACTGEVPVTLSITDPATQATTREVVTSTETASWPDIAMPLKEGAASVTGAIGPGFTKVDIRVWRPGTQSDEMSIVPGPELNHVTNLVERQIVASQDSTFSLRLVARLGAGEIVQVCPVAEDSSPPRVVAERCAHSMVQGLEWGPVSARFTVGALFSQKDSNTSGSLDKTTSYVGLNVSTAWSGVHSTGWLGRHGLPPAFAVQSFFDAKLTQAGASEQGAGGDPNQASVVTKRAGVFQAGLSLPIFRRLLGYALFVAPIGKIGIQAIPDGYALRYGTTTDATGASVLDKDAEGRPVVLEQSTIAPLWSAGLRFGMGEVLCRRVTAVEEDARRLARARGHSDVASRGCRPGRVISHFDILVGQYQNYRETDLATGRTTSPWRMVIEGRLAAPDLPFELGFDVNLRLKGIERTPHDYRIFAALRFDAASAVAKVFGADLSGE